MKKNVQPIQQKQKNKVALMVVCGFISILLLLLNFLPNGLIDPFSYNIPKASAMTQTAKDNEFDPKIAQRFRSVESIVYYVRKHTQQHQNKAHQIELLSQLIRKRFVHAYAVYGLQENWIAVLMGRLVWRNLAAKVIPDEILTGNIAACSQVGIVIMSCCQQLGIPTRKVALQGHFVVEAYADGKWYYIDANLKPNFKAIGGRKSLREILNNKDQYKLYNSTVLDSANITRVFSEVTYFKPDRHPAPRAFLFQYVSRILSKTLWILPFIYIVLSKLCRKKSGGGVLLGLQNRIASNIF